MKDSKEPCPNKGMYSAKLHETCKYIMAHLDEFKGFKIYEYMKPVSEPTRPTELAKSTELKEDKDNNLHNCLKAQFDFLIGGKFLKVVKIPQKALILCLL